MSITVRTISLAVFALFFACQAHVYGQASPWGTGDIINQNIGQLVDTTVIFPSNSGRGSVNYFIPTQTALASYNYDIYIPPSYDGTEPYGLITFINSGNTPTGAYGTGYKAELDDRNIIWVAGYNIGNSVFNDARMGVAMAAVYRLMEVLNIDTSRVYTSGNSGGARVSHSLAYIYPEIFSGAIPRCGASYLRQVDQSYETQNPNSHYEYIEPFTASDLAYVRSFNQRYAILTSYNDFREGDIMNIYHNGMEKDGFDGKILEVSGGHCATSRQQFKDAMNFIEHRNIELINESFDGGIGNVGNGFATVNANESGGYLKMESATSAQANARDIYLWNDEQGAILSVEVSPDVADFNNNSVFSLGTWQFDEPSLFCDSLGRVLTPGMPGLQTVVAFGPNQPKVYVLAENPGQSGINDTLFSGEFRDWEIDTFLRVKYHLWDFEWRIEFSDHIDSFQFTESSGVRLLDDFRSIEIKWNNLTSNFWADTIWDKGALLTMNANAINSANSSGHVLVDKVTLVIGDTISPTSIPDLNIGIIRIGDTLLADTGFNSYQWYRDNNPINGATTAVIAIDSNGFYNVVVNEGGICNAVSNTIMVNDTSTGTSIHQLVPNSIKIHPNPGNGIFYLKKMPASAKIYLRDMLGNVVHKVSSDRIDIRHLPNGLYILEVDSNLGHQAIKLIKK